ncbi:MAG: DEAD/DEAH box helicase [Patescibacteria group bacterium]
MSQIRRLAVICPMRSHCETIRAIFENGEVSTFLKEHFNQDLEEMARCQYPWGIVAGTGTGKTFFVRQIAQTLFGENFSFDVVNREEEATEKTWRSDVLVITSGVAMHYLKAGIFSENDIIIIDEIHQTSEHLEVAMALAKKLGITVCWMSATIDSDLFSKYFGTSKILACAISDPEKQASVKVLEFASRASWFYRSGIQTQLSPVEYYLSSQGGLNDIIQHKRGSVVFVPTRREAEVFADKYAKTAGLHVDFYHGGENAKKLRKYLRGEIERPFLIFMTAAGSSSLNISGLDTVIIQDETFRQVVHSGVKVLEKVSLSNNDILQMAGRVIGRVNGGSVIILTHRSIIFEELRPQLPEFVLGGDLEQVALICARLDISLDELDPIGDIDRDEFARIRQLLRQRKLISEDNKLTGYGEKIDRLPVSRAWAENLITAEPDTELFAVVLVCSCISSLYDLLIRNQKQEFHGIAEMIISGNDFLTGYSIIEEVVNNDALSYVWKDNITGETEYRFTKEFPHWCRDNGVSSKAVREVLLAVKSVCRAYRQPLYRELPVISPGNDLEGKFNRLLIAVRSLELAAHNGLTIAGHMVFPSSRSVCGHNVGGQRAMRGAMIGQSRAFKTKSGHQLRSFEGVELNVDDIHEYIDGMEVVEVEISPDGSKAIVAIRLSAFGFSDFMMEKMERDRLPTNIEPQFLSRAQYHFFQLLANYPERLMPAEQAAENRAVIAAVLSLKRAEQPLAFFYEMDVARDCYRHLIGDRVVYTTAMAREQGIDLKLRLDSFYSPQRREALESAKLRQAFRISAARRW